MFRISSNKTCLLYTSGLSPYPAAWTELVQPGGESVVVKIFETEKIGESHQLAPGTLQTDGKTYIRVAAEDGFVGICSLQLPGKKRLKTDELLRGFRLTEEGDETVTVAYAEFSVSRSRKGKTCQVRASRQTPLRSFSIPPHSL